MVRRQWLPVVAVFSIGLAFPACGSQIQSKPPAVTPAPVVEVPAPAPVPPPQPPPDDPVDLLIAAAQRHFTSGEHELELGHLERARAEFNQALRVLLESPAGARSEPRVREYFDRLVDRISAHEITALTVGDGFTEKTYDVASIDELLALSTFEPPPASPELKEVVATDLQSTRHDIPIPLNAKILSYIQLFQGKLRPWMEEGLRQGARYLPMIQNVFRAEGLPLDLAYVPLIESAFNPNAVSRAKATGVWQFMRGTAGENGLKRDWYIDERADPEKATLAAAKYLRTLNTFFSGDWHLALASYNGGPGTVQHAINRTRQRDFWVLAQKPRLLPRETREYVPMILAAIVIARNPAQYGLEVLANEPLAYEKVKVPGPVDLRRIAEWAGVPVGDIRALNPELLRWTTPVRYPGGYDLKVPVGTAAAVQERLQAAEGEELATLRWYTVRRGETLVTIARMLGVSRTNLAEANYLSVRAAVTLGQQLIIPRETTPMLSARADRPGPAAPPRQVAPATGPATTQPPDRGPAETKLVYRVKSGDTLFDIAKLFRISVESLKLWNHLRSDTINPGDRLTIFTKGLAPRA